MVVLVGCRQQAIQAGCVGIRWGGLDRLEAPCVVMLKDFESVLRAE